MKWSLIGRESQYYQRSRTIWQRRLLQARAVPTTAPRCSGGRRLALPPFHHPRPCRTWSRGTWRPPGAPLRRALRRGECPAQPAPVPVRDLTSCCIPLPFVDRGNDFERRDSTRLRSPELRLRRAAYSRTPGRVSVHPASASPSQLAASRLRYNRVPPSARSAHSSPRHSPPLRPGGPGARARRHPAGLRGL
jgi:hypothetical protein